MLDVNLAVNLLSTARRMIRSKSSQAELRRSVSTSYYAVFHALAKIAADSLVGSKKSLRSNKAWVEVYRGLSHGPCKASCKDAHKIAFPSTIHDFAENFVQLQEARHRADYDPTFSVNQSEALFYYSLADYSIKALKTSSNKDLIAFSAWVLITSRGAQEARKQARSSGNNATQTS